MSTRILWVTDELPDSDLGGGSIRQYHLLRRIADRALIDLLLVGELRDDDLRKSLGRVIQLPRPPAPRPTPRWRGRLDGLWALGRGGLPGDVRAASPVRRLLQEHLSSAESYDVVQIEHEEFAPLLPRRRSNRWAITLHNLISVRWRQRAAISEKRRVRWLFESDAARSERFERWITNSFDVTITMSHEDAALLDGPAVVVPNGVDLDRFRPSPLPPQPVLLFSASFNWEPNIDGAVWFCEQVLPLVRQSLPDATLLLVGRRPDVQVRRLLDLPGVEAQFDVPSVVPFLESARIAVVPVRMGSGTRLKALEAMAAGRPVAGTAVGLEGLGLRDGVSAVVADEPDALAARVVRLCTDDVLAGRLAKAARPLAEQLSWDRVADRYLDQVLAEPPRSAMA